MTDTTLENHSNDESVTEHGERQRPSYDDVNIPVVIMVGVISMVLTFVTIWFVEGLYYQWSNGLIKSEQYKANSLAEQTIIDQKEVLNGDTERKITSLESVKGEILSRYKNSDAANDDHSESHDGDSRDAGSPATETPKDEGH